LATPYDKWSLGDAIVGAAKGGQSLANFTFALSGLGMVATPIFSRLAMAEGAVANLGRGAGMLDRSLAFTQKYIVYNPVTNMALRMGTVNTASGFINAWSDPQKWKAYGIRQVAIDFGIGAVEGAAMGWGLGMARAGKWSASMQDMTEANRAYIYGTSGGRDLGMFDFERAAPGTSHRLRAIGIEAVLMGSANAANGYARASYRYDGKYDGWHAVQDAIIGVAGSTVTAVAPIWSRNIVLGLPPSETGAPSKSLWRRLVGITENEEGYTIGEASAKAFRDFKEEGWTWRSASWEGFYKPVLVNAGISSGIRGVAGGLVGSWMYDLDKNAHGGHALNSLSSYVLWWAWVYGDRP
jgi:hypothetical protein